MKQRRERRRPSRPSNGDTLPCPKCQKGIIEFNERYRIPSSKGVTTAPAWICDVPACGYAELARR